VLGKLLNAYGEDNVIWGSDSIWYGSAQQLIDAFRVFQIPEEMREEFGYPELTESIKQKVLSLNAAKLYGIDLDAVRHSVRNDDLAWARQILADYNAQGFDQLR
jgi:uncharacterized protein